MLRKAFALAWLGIAGLGLAACDTLDDESASAPSQAEQAYGACQPSYEQKADSFKEHWAFVSGVDASGRHSCYWVSQADSSAAASRAAYDDCRKSYDTCFIFATNDGPSDWVQRMSDDLKARHSRDVTLSRDDGSGSDASDAGGGDRGASDDGASLGDIVGALADLLNGMTGVVEAAQGGGARGGGFSSPASPVIPRGNGYSQRGAFDDCAKLFDALGPAGAPQKAECERRARNMETAH